MNEQPIPLPVPVVVAPLDTRIWHTWAVLSAVLGVLAWVALPVLGAVGAIVAGHYARSELRQDAGVRYLPSSATWAVTGLILGWVHLVCVVLPVVLLLGIALFVLSILGLVALF